MDSTCLLMNKRKVLFASIRILLFDIFRDRRKESYIIQNTTLKTKLPLYIFNAKAEIVSEHNKSIS